MRPLDGSERDRDYLFDDVARTGEGGERVSSEFQTPPWDTSSDNDSESEKITPRFSTENEVTGPADIDLPQRLREAADAARELAQHLSALADQSGNEGAGIAVRRTRALGALNEIREAVARAGGIEELATLRTLLEGWEQKPNDLLIMVKVAEEASTLSGILRSHVEILQLLEEV
jgi:hypothetical protein